MCFTLIACNFETCAAQATAQDAARTGVHESFGAVRSQTAQCQALSDNLEKGDTYVSTSGTVVEEAALWR